MDKEHASKRIKVDHSSTRSKNPSESDSYSDKFVTNHVNSIIKGSDISTLTLRSVMNKLEDSLFCDFSSRKELVRGVIEAYVNREAELIKTISSSHSNKIPIENSSITTYIDSSANAKSDSEHFVSAFDYAEAKTSEDDSPRNSTLHKHAKAYKGLINTLVLL